MQLEAVVRPLVVVPKGSKIFGDPVPINPMQFDGGINETKGGVDAEVSEKMP